MFLATNINKNDMYLDDTASGANTEEDVKRMIGNVTHNGDGSIAYSGTVSHILSKGGFRVKMMVRSGEDDPRVLDKMGSSALGHDWLPKYIFPK